MTKYEIKKVFSKTGSKLALLILFAVLGIICYLALDVTYVNENGQTERGRDAVLQLKAAQKEWAGRLDEEQIGKVIAENVRIRNTPEYSSSDLVENEIAYSWGQGIRDIRNLLNCSYAEEFRTYDYYRADSLSEADAFRFYDNRTELLKEWLDTEAKEQYSGSEKEFLISQYDKMDTPLYYDSMNGWLQLFNYAATVIMITMLILGYLVAGIFSNEFTWKSDAILFSSFHGRDQAVSAKLKAGFCIVTAVYFLMFFLYSAVVLLYFGADGWNLPIQTSWTSWKSFYNITMLQKYILIGIGGYIGCLFISFLSMLVSAKTRSSVVAVMTPVIIIFLPSFISGISNPIISKITGLLPDQLLQVQTALNYFNLYDIGGKIYGEMPVLLVLYLCLLMLILPALYHVYRHIQVG